MNPNERHELTLVDYYALAIAPAVYRYFLEKTSEKPISYVLDQLIMARTSVFEEARHLATLSLNLRNQSPTEGSRDERAGT